MVRASSFLGNTSVCVYLGYFLRKNKLCMVLILVRIQKKYKCGVAGLTRYIVINFLTSIFVVADIHVPVCM